MSLSGSSPFMMHRADHIVSAVVVLQDAHAAHQLRCGIGSLVFVVSVSHCLGVSSDSFGEPLPVLHKARQSAIHLLKSVRFGVLIDTSLKIHNRLEHVFKGSSCRLNRKDL